MVNWTDLTCELAPASGRATVSSGFITDPKSGGTSDTLATAWLWTTIEPMLYIICACLPGVYSFFRATFGRLCNGHSKPTYRAQPQLPTIGSTPLRLKQNREDEEDGVIGVSNSYNYHVACEPGPERDWYGMASLDPVHVQRDFTVTSN